MSFEETCVWLLRSYKHYLDLTDFGSHRIKILVIISGPCTWEINRDHTWLKENNESISFKSHV